MAGPLAESKLLLENPGRKGDQCQQGAKRQPVRCSDLLARCKARSNKDQSDTACANQDERKCLPAKHGPQCPKELCIASTESIAIAHKAICRCDKRERGITAQCTEKSICRGRRQTKPPGNGRYEQQGEDEAIGQPEMAQVQGGERNQNPTERSTHQPGNAGRDQKGRSANKCAQAFDCRVQWINPATAPPASTANPKPAGQRNEF